jgi:hypothetical protein
MRISADQRQQNEARIRAAIDRLLGGDIPPGGKCDVKTLARQAAFSELKVFPQPVSFCVALSEFRKPTGRPVSRTGSRKPPTPTLRIPGLASYCRGVELPRTSLVEASLSS